MLALERNDNKIFVLDTNVILHDHRCVYSFEEHNVVIPMTVLEEIDKFKKGNETINYNAREFIRSLDEIAEDALVDKGVRLENGGTITIVSDNDASQKIAGIFAQDKPDNRIIAAAYKLAAKFPSRVTLVSKDINLRIKARALGLKSENYETGTIKDIDELYKGRRLIENVDLSIVEDLKTHGQIVSDVLVKEYSPRSNEYFEIKSGDKIVLVRYDKAQNIFIDIGSPTAYSITPRNSEQAFALDAIMNDDIKLVTLSGKAGTGKTLMALAGALEKRKEYRQIFLARPIVPLSNRDLGYLPGDVKSKLDPFMQPLFDNLSVIQHQFEEADTEYKRITDMLEKDKLLITPLAYIRGRSLAKIFFIIDEAQNLTPHEVKTIITRAGDGTKIVFTGDPYQIDTPYLDSHSNGLTTLIDKMKDHHLYAHVTLEKGERSELSELASDLL